MQIRNLSRLLIVAVSFQLAGIALISNAGAQIVECELTQIDANSLSGTCTGPVPPELSLKRGEPGSDVLWTGKLSEGSLVWPVEIASYQYETEAKRVIRTPAGWFLLTGSGLPTSPIQLKWDIRAEAPPSRQDLKIVQAAREILNDESVWDRADDRVCDPGDTTYSLYCALARATKEAMGKYQHRQPAMQVVRRIVGEQWPDRLSNHRLMDFNNHPDTTHADLQKLFALAEEKIRKQIK